jgi:glycosyltransferase involved in cell wall biosynthesis
MCIPSSRSVLGGFAGMIVQNTARSLRIAHVTATFPPYYGGTGNVSYHSARALAARGHEVHVLTAAWPGPRDDPPGVQVHRLRPMAQIGNALVLPGLVRQLRGFDVVHLHHPFIGGGDLAAGLSWLRRMPLVLTYHNDLRAPGLRGALFAAYERTTTRGILASARRIGVVSVDHAAASPLLRSLVQARSERLIELPNGVDATGFRPGLDGDIVRARAEIPAEAFVVFFAGALDTAHHFKRLDVLLRAIDATGDPRVWALVAGSGDLQPSYQTLADELGIGGRVRFVGAVPHHNLPPYFAAADVLALPSDATESFGIVLIEAMASGCPVIATDLPGVRTIVSHGRDGLVVAPGDVDALRRAIADVARMPVEVRRTMGHAGRAKVEACYDWERIGERLEAMYAEVVAEGDARER